jgi:simple sugar transport system substrate-binding protein
VAVKNEKTFFHVFLILILLAACRAPERVWTYEDLVVGFLQTGSEGPWRLANTDSFRETAEELGITLKLYDAQGYLSHQEEDFRRFVADEEVNVIVLAALETTGWEDELLEAREAGKIVILEDRRIDVSADLYATYVGSDFVEEGRRAAIEMCRLLAGMPGRIIWELVGQVGSAAARDRGVGFREKMGECGIELISSTVGNWSMTEGKQITEAWLQESRDVQGIFAQSDEMALGAIVALKEAGLRPGVDVKIVAVDGTAGAFQAMLAGELNASVECNPLLAPQVYEAALKALNGEPLPKWIRTQEGVFRLEMPDLQEIAESRKY